ncbi:unnamed protein product [Xylocopa violacea]|uniref:Uncharacterized protein n=1 Tax=Xylocopa violacea TaxID=135666 RepID=A0ABP1NFZ4_XYLVO
MEARARVQAVSKKPESLNNFNLLEEDTVQSPEEPFRQRDRGNKLSNKTSTVSPRIYIVDLHIALRHQRHVLLSPLSPSVRATIDGLDWTGCEQGRVFEETSVARAYGANEPSFGNDTRTQCVRPTWCRAASNRPAFIGE